MIISIITATYNSSATVRDTLESVLRQTYKNYEYVIVDGASKDDTLNILREYEPLFEGKMIIVSEPDRGLYDAMNKGISRTTGDVVGILNSDDFYSSDDALQTIVDSFENDKNLGAVYGDVQYVKEDDTTKKVRYYSSKLFRRGLMRFGFMPAHPTFYCKRAIYEQFALDTTNIKEFKGSTKKAYFNTNYKIAADFENLLRIIYIGQIKTQYIQKNFVTMRIGGVSSSGIASHKQINRDHLRALREHHIYSNVLFLGLRYIYKIGELVHGWICNWISPIHEGRLTTKE